MTGSQSALSRIVLFSVALAATSACASTRKPVRILFVGNSYTYYNNLPRVAETLYEATNKGAFEVGMLVQAGQRLSDVAGPRMPEFLRMLMGGRWDYVVLQEQSSLGGGFGNGRPVLGNPGAFHEAVRALDKEIRRSGGRTVLLETWANERAPEQQGAISEAYASIADEIGALVVPAGQVWKAVRSAHPGIRLHQADGSHPAETGTYLTACLLLETLFEIDLSGAPARLSVPDILSPERRGTQVISIDPGMAAALREAAAND